MKRSSCVAILFVLTSVVLAFGRQSQNLVFDPPRVFCMRPDALAKTKARIMAGDRTLQPAMNQLLKQANKALKAEPVSVTDKTFVPPSGDKHDYMSFGPYWWPDPTKKDGLPYVKRDGKVNPESFKDSDSPRLNKMVHRVRTLAMAYYFTGQEKYARHAAHLLRVWFLAPSTRMNPHLKYGQAVPGSSEGRCFGIIDSRHFAQLVDAIGMLATSQSWTTKDQQGMVEWFDRYLNWLRTSAYGQEADQCLNNHATWYDVQVASIAFFVGQPDLAKKVLTAVKSRRIESQIEPDGRQPHELARTRSFSYSLMNLQGMFDLATLGKRAGVDLWHDNSADGRGIRKALEFLAPYANPNEQWPYEQISSVNGARTALLPLLWRASAVYGEKRYNDLINRFPQHTVAEHRMQLLYPR